MRAPVADQQAGEPVRQRHFRNIDQDRWSPGAGQPHPERLGGQHCGDEALLDIAARSEPQEIVAPMRARRPPGEDRRPDRRPHRAPARAGAGALHPPPNRSCDRRQQAGAGPAPQQRRLGRIETDHEHSACRLGVFHQPPRAHKPTDDARRRGPHLSLSRRAARPAPTYSRPDRRDRSRAARAACPPPRRRRDSRALGRAPPPRRGRSDAGGARRRRRGCRRRRKPGTLTPGRVRRDFGRLAALAGTPASPPKPSRAGPGRPKGRTSTPAPRHPVLKRAALRHVTG